MKNILIRILPENILFPILALRRKFTKLIRRFFEISGYNIGKKSDYYSPLPTESRIEKNLNRWNKPSSMIGIKHDFVYYEKEISRLISQYLNEFLKLPDYKKNYSLGFGPGYTELDAFLLYLMIRDIKPKKYLEIGSGLSTYYCSLAAQENARENYPLEIICVEPFPYKKLYSIPGIKIIKDEVQNVGYEPFLNLEKNDILFIDSSHTLRLDGDVPYIYLEVLPRLKTGVKVHIHDIPFPYNTPFPAKQWVLCKENRSPHWPMFWNEAMVLQAFLCFNSDYSIIMSAPLIRHFDETFLRSNIPFYKSVQEEPNTFSSIWLENKK
jgi:hypothetical protein